MKYHKMQQSKLSRDCRNIAVQARVLALITLPLGCGEYDHPHLLGTLLILIYCQHFAAQARVLALITLPLGCGEYGHPHLFGHYPFQSLVGALPFKVVLASITLPLG